MSATQVTDEGGQSSPRIGYKLNITDHNARIHTARFWELASEFELHHWRVDRWPCDLQVLPDALVTDSSEVNGWCPDENGTCVVQLANGERAALQSHVASGYVDLTAAARNREGAAQAIAWARQFLPVAKREDPHRIPIIFWHDTKRGVSSLRRMINIVTWAEIEANYAASTRQQLAGLMSDFHPARGGQLLLFHGDAGTGKTFALRALGAEWRRWCDIDYVVDSDRFLGEAEYLLDVLLARGGDWEDAAVPDGLLERLFGGSVPFGADPNDTSRWRLIVLEDTGELLSADAKERTGQGLSRLLNTVDGLIGQGLRSLVLVTTNEPIRELHPAVARAGRCAAAVEFLPLSAQEASAWAGREIEEPITLADLYALREGYGGADVRLWPELPDEADVPRTNGSAGNSH